jgi:hypothetical protein
MRTLLLMAALAAPPDAEYRRALELVYEGRADAALRRLEELSAGDPADPLPVYLQSLALAWKVEQEPAQGPADRELLRRVDRAVALADARLRAEPEDARALLARGGAHGVSSRYHCFRVHRGDAARAAVRMRADLLRLRELEPANVDALFGLGLYDYYADVLSPLAKVVRFVARIPGGNRRRGLEEIREARESFWHGTEVRAQLYEIGAFWEDRPDDALAEMEALRRRHPDWPLWGLKLAEHLRERMGLYAESARVAREMLAQGGRGHPHYAGAALAQARLALGEALLLDLRLGEARTTLLPMAGGRDAVSARAHLALARALELEGDRVGAQAHYRQAEAGTDKEARRRARRALDAPAPAALVEASHLLARARRAREGGERDRAAALYRGALGAWPDSDEAAARLAEHEVLRGDPRTAREVLRRVDARRAQPPWVRPCAQLVRAQLRDLEGRREDAVTLYKEVLLRPFGQHDLAARASDGLRSPFRRAGQPH